MQFRKFKLRFRRQLRKQRRQVEDLSQQADGDLEKYFFRRLGRLKDVWRFAAGWLVLFVLLIGITAVQLHALSNTYQKLEPVPGGIYTEGLLGTFTNANPIYATSGVDRTVSHLLFAGLFKYNDQNQLVGDLAEGWSANKKGTVYTVKLRPHLVWQDGAPLTADDVVFTYRTIQNPDVQSPLNSSWAGVKVAKVDDQTVTFTLPDPLSSFPYTLINGIVPKHLLKDVSAADLRSADFNTKRPVGAGPFQWQAVEVSGSSADNAETRIAMLPFKRYHSGAPKLDSFIIRAFANKQQLVSDFESGQLTAVAGLPVVPGGMKDDNSIEIHNLPTTAATMVFFNNTHPLLADAKVRQALVMGADRRKVISELDYPARPVREPLLPGQLGYDPDYQQTLYNPEKATAILAKDGWKRKPGDRLLHKKHKTLTVHLFSVDTPEYQKVTRTLKDEWGKLGVDIQLHAQDINDFQGTLASGSYDAVLESISIGVDPDVFVYWDSSQNDNGLSSLNFSHYDSAAADTALEAGRTRLDPELRTVKYRPFLKAWQKDAPALSLYQPRFLYVTHGPVYGLTDHAVNTGTDRFSNVQNWMIRQAKVTE